MFTRLRRFAAVLISLALLSSCSGEAAPKAVGGNYKAGAEQPSGSAESSVLGRKVEYAAYTPAEGLALPFDAGAVESAAQIEKIFYFLGEGAVYSLDTETGTSEKLFDTPADAIASHGEKLYAYTFESYTLSEYDHSGQPLGETVIPVGEVDSIEGLYITDDYCVFKSRTKGEKLIETDVLTYSLETREQILSKSAPMSGINLYPYKENLLFAVTLDTTFDVLHLGAFDVETGKSKALCNLDYSYTPAVAYSQKTDTVLVFGVPYSVGFTDLEPVINAACPITEYSLSDTDSIVLNRYYINVSYDAEFFLGIWENAVFAFTSSGGGIMVYDYLNPPESITIMGYAGTSPEIINGFEKSTGILVRTAHTEYDRMLLNLMASDSDFDLFNNGMAFQNYINAGTFVDLKTVESLSSRISKNAAAELVASCGDKYFGVPALISNYSSEENFPEDGSSFCYSLSVSELIYFAQNVDVAEQRYDDPDGEGLYKLFKFINDNPTGNRKKMPFGDSVTILSSNVYLMNPKAQNRDGAIRFLEYLFDIYNGDIPGIVPEEDYYPKLESAEGCYAEWRCRPVEIISPIFDARNDVKGKNGEMSRADLKKLAHEAAAEVAMRMGE